MESYDIIIFEYTSSKEKNIAFNAFVAIYKKAIKEFSLLKLISIISNIPKTIRNIILIISDK